MERKALIFNIQKYNLYDGPGIRTLVFFKGCPLRCLWCSNPEGQKRNYQILFKKDLCTHCEACASVCPAGVHVMDFVEKKHSIRRDVECVGCGRCVEACTRKALSMTGEFRTISEILEVIEEDRMFYQSSGGGVTLGGGEVLMQPEAAINLLSAWRYTAGDSRVIVAVLDGGVKCDHKDLVANMWVNEGEVAGDGIDNDGNGYVDDVHGYNFCANNANIQADDHGTHVAGTIAAVNNNGYLGCGIAGGTGNGDGCRIMSCQIFDGSSTASVSQIAAAIKYAADNGAVIMNNSWAYAKGSYTTDSSFKNQFSALINAIDYFEQNAKLEGVIDGGIALFAAGNDGYGVPSYPGAYYNNICYVVLLELYSIVVYQLWRRS